MKLQLLSDLHLETEVFDPQPAPGAELLVLAGDIDASWAALQRFAGWPVPVIFVPGNHEFDGRDLDSAEQGLREACARAGITMLHRQSLLVTDAGGRIVRFLGTVRWSDFDAFGTAARDRSMRAAGYFLRLMAATHRGRPVDAQVLRDQGLACRSWLERELALPPRGRWDRTVVVTHFGPSLRSADPRYGRQPGTASFCNDDDDLVALSDGWLHGHLHCRHDYRVERPGRAATRVVCQSRGLEAKGEAQGLEPLRVFEF
jgi:hypothetical protein